MPGNRLIVGTRGSKLALAQTELATNALRRLQPELAVETKIIKTTGDMNQSPIPLDTVGKSWFTAEIEQALTEGEIDLAIHSLKDMSLQAPAGLETILILERADPRDAFISKSGGRLDDLPQGAIVGTDSVRRKALLLERRPDLSVKSIRGNVDTRLKKMREGTGDERYDALVLAAAGLDRLGMLDVAGEIFDPQVFLPAPGQGVLAAQVRADRTELAGLLHSIEHAPTRIAAEAELAFARAIGGGCKVPIGCYALVDGESGDNADKITIHAVMGDLSGGKPIRKSAVGPVGEAMRLVQELAEHFPKIKR